MIRTAADILKALAAAEMRRISSAGIKHAPTIGAMYEGLSAGLLARVLPEDLNLKVVSGFATSGLGAMSGQIDCMLVRGEGEAVPHTTLHKWPVEDIIAILEIKKTLYGAELAESYLQVADVLRVYSDWLQNSDRNDTLNLRASFRAFAEITGELAPSAGRWKEHRTRHRGKHLILHAVMSDQMAPIRVVLGYGGYKTEAGLRNGFIEYLDKHIAEQGFGVPTLPNLIIAGEHALIKLTGHPYHTPMFKSGFWPIVASTRVNPMLVLLETIWTRLSYLRPMWPAFGEDLEVENLALLLSAKPMERPDQPGQWGWMYRETGATEAELAARKPYTDWTPVELTSKQFQVVHRLCEETEINVSAPRFAAFYGDEQEPVDAFLEGLIATTLVARDGDIIKLTTVECMTAVMPDGRFMAADNNTGRFERWLSKTMATSPKPATSSGR